MRTRHLTLAVALCLTACAPATAPAPEAIATIHVNPTLYPTDPPATATLEEIVLPTLTRRATQRPTSGATWTLTASEATRAAAKFSPTPVPPTSTRVRITFTPAPVQPAVTATAAPAVIADTPTTAPVILDTPTAAPVVEQPTAAPPPSGGGYVCDGGAACIKGNISSNGHLYHFPGCPSYNATKIDEGAGERYFTSAAEAEAAGWTKAGNCP